MYIYIHTYIHTYLPYITLHYITLHYITLHYITLHTYVWLIVIVYVRLLLEEINAPYSHSSHALQESWWTSCSSGQPWNPQNWHVHTYWLRYKHWLKSLILTSSDHISTFSRTLSISLVLQQPQISMRSFYTPLNWWQRSPQSLGTCFTQSLNHRKWLRVLHSTYPDVSYVL